MSVITRFSRQRHGHFIVCECIFEVWYEQSILLGCIGVNDVSPQAGVSQMLLSWLQAQVFRLIKVVNISGKRHLSY